METKSRLQFGPKSSVCKWGDLVMLTNNHMVGSESCISRRNLFKAAGLVALIGFSTSSFMTGCSSAEASSEKKAVALVIDKGRNSALADGSSECAYQVFKPVISDGGYLVVDVVSSRPAIVCSNDVKPANNSTELAHENRWKKDGAFDSARNIDDQLPDAEEVDILKALKQVVCEFDTNAGEYPDRTVYIASSGLQTCGILDFTGHGPYGNLLEWDYDSLLDRIAEDSSSGAVKAEALPNLTGIHVEWMGFGDLVAGAQCEIPTMQLAKLKDLWARTLTYCGADFDPEKDFVNCPLDSGESFVDRTALPQVTPVVFGEALTTSTISFDENVLGFLPGEDLYSASQDYVESVLVPYADSLKKTGAKIVVLGTTANDGDVLGCYDLGRRRAERVKSDLVSLGVRPEQVVVCSAGCEGANVRIGAETVDFYHDNFDSDGSWNESVAKTNRAIHFIPASLAENVIARFSV